MPNSDPPDKELRDSLEDLIERSCMRGEGCDLNWLLDQLLSLFSEELGKERANANRIDHSIDVRYEKNIIEAFNKFIEKWCGNSCPHLIDSDENDGQFMRNKIYKLLDKVKLLSERSK